MFHRHHVAAALCALTVACASSAAHASNIRFDFTATVTTVAPNQTLRGVEVGTTFNGSFSYDPDNPPPFEDEGSNTIYHLFPHGISANIGEARITAPHTTISVYDNTTPAASEGVWVSGAFKSTPGGGEQWLEGGEFGFQLWRTPGSDAGVVNGFGLPSSYDVAAFEGDGAVNQGWLQSNGQPGHLLEFKINSITAVPEPGSLALLTLGMTAVTAAAAARRRRKQL